MKKLLAVFAIALLLSGCPRRVEKVQVAAKLDQVAQAEAAEPVSVSQTFTVNVGDTFYVEFTANSGAAVYHSVGFDVLYPACLVPVAGSFEPGDIFSGQTPDIACNEFTGRLYVSATVARGKAGDSGEDYIGQFLFTATGPGAGAVTLNNLKALKYDDSAMGFSEIETQAENFELAFEQAIVELVRVKVNLVKQ